MAALIRKMIPEDSRAFLEVHHAAVRGVAARDYPPEVIDAWAPLPITEEAIASVRANSDGEYRLVAEIDGRVVGIAALIVKNAELRACYVAPGVNHQGIGSALVHNLERVASEHGVDLLQLNSSLTAAPFYAAQGYEVSEYQEHILRSGRRMACVKMRKTLMSSKAASRRCRPCSSV
jgi:putative acetyltransferase